MSTIVHIRLDGPPEALAAARELLEDVLGELVHLGQIVPSKRDTRSALSYGTLRLPERAAGAAREITAPPL